MCLPIEVQWANELLIEREGFETAMELEYLFRHPPAGAGLDFLNDGLQAIVIANNHTNQRLQALWQREVCTEC